MSADTWLVVIGGVVIGFGFGYVTAWRFARKLEHHDVRLREWDQHFDAQAPLTTVTKFPERQSQR